MRARKSCTLSSSDTSDPAPAMSSHKSSERLSVVTSIHIIYAVGTHRKLVFIDTFFNMLVLF